MAINALHAKGSKPSLSNYISNHFLSTLHNMLDEALYDVVNCKVLQLPITEFLRDKNIFANGKVCR